MRMVKGVKGGAFTGDALAVIQSSFNWSAGVWHIPLESLQRGVQLTHGAP
jgi:hypothetical protein